MTIKSEEVEKIAFLARLRVAEDNRGKLTEDLSQILDFVDQMKAVDTRNVTPLSNPLEMHQILRPDTVTEENQRDRLQAVAPATELGLFLVPKVIE